MNTLTPLLTALAPLAQKLGVTVPDILLGILGVVILGVAGGIGGRRAYHLLGGLVFGLGVYVIAWTLFDPRLWSTGGWLMGSYTGWIVIGAAAHLIFVFGIAFMIFAPVSVIVWHQRALSILESLIVGVMSYVLMITLLTAFTEQTGIFAVVNGASMLRTHGEWYSAYIASRTHGLVTMYIQQIILVTTGITVYVFSFRGAIGRILGTLARLIPQPKPAAPKAAAVPAHGDSHGGHHEEHHH